MTIPTVTHNQIHIATDRVRFDADERDSAVRRHSGNSGNGVVQGYSGAAALRFLSRNI